MIVREIKEIGGIPHDFDYFNDYKDTRKWLLKNCPELVEELDIGFVEYNVYWRG